MGERNIAEVSENEEVKDIQEEKGMISFKVFMRFVDKNGDASKVLSKECFDMWVVTRKCPPKQPEESFRRVLTAHICGVDGRRPFPVHIERHLLQILRKKEVWDCFKGTSVSIGVRGFRNQGYHETIGLNNTNIGLARGKKRGLDFCSYPNKSLKLNYAYDSVQEHGFNLPLAGFPMFSPIQVQLQAQLNALAGISAANRFDSSLLANELLLSNLAMSMMPNMDMRNMQSLFNQSREYDWPASVGLTLPKHQ